MPSIETAVNLLKSQNLSPVIRTIGGDSSVVAKLIDDYTLTIRELKTKPGYFYANLKNGDVLVQWNELDEGSLPLAVDYALNLRQNINSINPTLTPTQLPTPTSTQPRFRLRIPNPILWTGTIVVVILAASTSYYVTWKKISTCNYQQQPASSSSIR